jgi:hypothetical protein
MSNLSTINFTAIKLYFLERIGFTQLDAPFNFRCDKCGSTVFKGSFYYRKVISSASGVDDYCICLKCATSY